MSRAADGFVGKVADVTGPRKGIYHYNRARILLQIDPTAKEQALKYLDEALAAAGYSDSAEDEDAAMAVRGSAPLNLPTAAPASKDDEYSAAWKAL